MISGASGSIACSARGPTRAYELKPVVSLSLVVDTLADENDGDNSPGHLSLREAIDLANANPMPDTISFDPSLAGGTIHLTLGELAITDSVTILGPGAGITTIDAGNHSRFSTSTITTTPRISMWRSTG